MSVPADSGSETGSNLSVNSSDRDWNRGMKYAGRDARWLTQDSSELYVEEDAGEYLLRYRDGRFGCSETLGVFEEEIEAILEAGRSMSNPEYLEELR